MKPPTPWTFPEDQRSSCWPKGCHLYEQEGDHPQTSPLSLRNLLWRWWWRSPRMVRTSWGRIGGQSLYEDGFLNGKDGSVASLPTDIWSVLVTTSAQAITIPVTLYKSETGKITETITLIDSGATICCIYLYLPWRIKWPLKKLSRPMYVRNTNGTNNSGGIIQHQVKLSLHI